MKKHSFFIAIMITMVVGLFVGSIISNKIFPTNKVVNSDINFNEKLSDLFWFHENNLIQTDELREASKMMYIDYVNGTPLDSIQPLSYIFRQK